MTYDILFTEAAWRVIYRDWDDSYWRVYLTDAGSETRAAEIAAALNAKENA